MRNLDMMTDKYGEWACILGAAEGLGASFAKTLAQKGFNLILVDINGENLTSTAEDLRGKYHIHTTELTADLNLRQSTDQILTEIKSHSCRMMVYNAAYGPVKPFLKNSPAELDRYLNVNIGSTLHLVHSFIHQNKSQKAGILLLSSLAGFRGTVYVVPYAATKAFLWNFAEGLYYEFKDHPLDISVCVAGATATPNFLLTRPKKTRLSPMPMDPDNVAEEAIRYFGKKLFIVPGLSNKISHFILNRLLPRKWASTILNSTMNKMYS